jgi:hypothetical protein
MSDVRTPLLRTSERKDWRRCPWLWQQVWLEGWAPKRSPTWSVFGIAWHAALEYVYQPGYARTQGDYEDACDVFLEVLGDMGRKVGMEPDDEAEEYERKAVKLIPAKDLGPAMLMNYWKEYGPEPEWEVIHTEQTFQIDVPDPNDLKKTLVVYAGTWDALMRHKPTGRLWLWDHKSARSLPRPGYLELDDQAGSYLWVAKEVLVHKGLLTRKDRISGIIFNYALKSLPDARPVSEHGESLNKDGSVSKKQPAPRFLRHETIRTPVAQIAQADRVQDEALIMGKMRSGELPIYKNTAYDCERCILFDLCIAHENGDDWEDLRAAQYTKRDPYADHREEMERNGIEL